MAATPDRKAELIRAMVEPLAEDAGADIYDITLAGGKLVVALTRSGGIDLEALTQVARALNARLDEEDPISGSYTVEVTSPGLERPLRTVEHFAGAVGETVTVRTQPGVEGERRIRGTISAADDDGFTVVVDDTAADDPDHERRLSYDDIERARTTFQWGPAPKPGTSPKNKKARST